jgi:predicted DNA-binding transcriptional regulator YafY
VLLHASLEEANAHLCDMTGMFEKHENGLLMNTTTDSYHWFAWWLMQLPFNFTIQGPDELKEAMHAHVLRLQASYLHEGTDKEDREI